MIQQLVMYEEELAQINNICEVLHRDANARAVLVIDKNGQAFAQAGEVEQLDITSLSSLTAGNVAATGAIASLLAVSRQDSGGTPPPPMLLRPTSRMMSRAVATSPRCTALRSAIIGQGPIHTS